MSKEEKEGSFENPFDNLYEADAVSAFANFSSELKGFLWLIAQKTGIVGLVEKMKQKSEQI